LTPSPFIPLPLRGEGGRKRKEGLAPLLNALFIPPKDRKDNLSKYTMKASRLVNLTISIDKRDGEA